MAVDVIFSYLLVNSRNLLLLTLAAILGVLYLRSKKAGKLPPGPRGIPVLGYLPFFSPEKPHLQLEDMRQKYGNVFGMYLGSKFAVFLGDLETSKEAFNMEEFSGRPDGAFPISKNTTHFAAINGQPWKIRRKFTMKALRHLDRGAKMVQDISRTQIALALDTLQNSHDLEKDVNIRPFLTQASISVILNFACDKVFSPDHKHFQTVSKYLKFFAEHAASITYDITMPWTRPLLDLIMSYNKEANKVFDDMEALMRSEITSHLPNVPESANNWMDYYLQHYGKGDGEGSQLTNEDVSGDLQVMIFAGADTVRGSTEWFLMCMAEHQDIQEKVYREIFDQFGLDGDISYQHKDKVPYTEAAILESMRYVTLVPISPYHCAMKNTKFRGFDIPEGSLVFSCLWSIQNNPEYWAYPDHFRPEHFLNPDRTAVKVPEAFVPFSIGKRFCVGDKMALIEVFLFCVSILQRFKVLPPDGGLKMEWNLRVNMEPRHPMVKLVPRSLTST